MHACVFFLLLVIAQVFGKLELESVEYSIHSIQIDSKYSFDAAIFTLSFNEEVNFFDTIYEVLYNLSYPPPLYYVDNPHYCFPPFPCTYGPLNLSASLVSAVRMECQSEVVFDSVDFNYYADTPPPYLILFTGSKQDPLLNFFSQLGLISDKFQTVADPTTLYIFVILSYTLNGSPVMLVNNKIRVIGEDIKQGRCSLVFDTSLLPFVTLRGLFDDEDFNATVSEFKEKKFECSYYDSLQVARDIASAIDDITSATDYTVLQNIQLQNTLLQSSSAITGCIQVVEQYVTKDVIPYFVDNTTDCLRNPSDLAHATDPCCNTSLQFIQCCAPGPKTVTLPGVNDVNGTQLACKTPIQSTALLADYIINYNNAQNPIEGCRAITALTFDQQRASQYTQYIITCLQKIYGINYYVPSKVACSHDSDCFTYCDPLSYHCHIDWNNPDTDMINCHMQEMDPLVMQLLKTEWNMTQNASLDVFKSEYFSQMSTENCVGYGGFNIQWGAITHEWISNPIYKFGCTDIGYCSYNSHFKTCPEPGTYKCKYESDGVNATLSWPAYCAINAPTSFDCSYAGGTWNESLNPWYCELKSATTREECIPSELCPGDLDVDFFVHTQCSSAFCYDPYTILEEDCITQCNATIKKWNTKVASGSGFCQVMLADEFSCISADDYDYEWWPGRFWNDGFYNTEEECNKGMCSIGKVWYPAVPPDRCEEMTACTRQCRMCASKMDLCFNSNMSTCDCQIAGGSYSSTNKLCQFNLGRDSCTSNGYTFLSCNDLDKEQCDACHNKSSCPQYYDLLQCQYVTTFCHDEESCLALSGDCTDPLYALSSCPPTHPSPECSGVCAYTVIPIQGQWGCHPNDHPVGLFCIQGYYVNQTECLKQGPDYFWKEKYFTEAECTAPTSCNTGEGHNLRNITQCQQCGGKMEPIFTWEKGEYQKGIKRDMQWVKAETIQTSHWKPTLDFNKIKNTVNKVTVAQYYNAFQTEAKCLYNPLLQVINHIACDCTSSSDPLHPNPAVCYNDGTRVTSVGIQRFYAGVADSVKASSVQVQVYDDTLQATVNYIDVNINIISASQFRTDRTLTINPLSASLDQNPFAIIKNNKSEVIGQLLADGILFEFIPPGADPSSGDAQFVLNGDMRACIELRKDIPRSDSDFPVLDFAVASPNFTTWTPLNITVNQTSAGYCLLVKHPGNYFPILRKADIFAPTKHKFIDDKAVLAFIYIFGIIFILLSLVCVYQMYSAVQLMIANSYKLNLALVLFFFLFLFNFVRGLYLLILPSEKLEHNLSAKYFLSEAPEFFFFSVYSTIIFLWAELAVVINPKPFLYKFKWPFIITNIAMYALFIVVISIYQAVSSDRSNDIRKAYVYILAGACACAVVAFNIFGIKLIAIQHRANKLREDTKPLIIKLAATLATSSLAIMAQIAFLFVVTYSTVSPKVALVAYVFTEIIPSAVLIFLLRRSRQASKKQVRLASTTNNS